MGMMKFEVPHSLPVDDARKRIDTLLSYWKGKYGLDANWNGERCALSGKVMGITFDGSFAILPGKLSGEATDPGMLFRGKAQKYLTHKFEQFLDPKSSLESLGRSGD